MAGADTPLPGWCSRLPPALPAALAHLPALALGAALLALGVPLWLALPGVGLGAAALAWYWRLPIWWRLINLAFIPLLGLVLSLEPNPIWALAGFLLLALTSLGAVRTRVPLYLSSARAAHALAGLIPPAGRIIDLGCGLGGPLAGVKRLRPDVRVAGIEAAPLNWLVARMRLLGRGEVRLGSLWDADLSAQDVVYAYLSPAPMPRLWHKARAEMRPGSLLVSNSFAIPDVPPTEIVELHDRSQARLLIWRL